MELFTYTVLASPILWLVSIYLLHEWNLIWRYSLANFVALVIYGALIMMTDMVDLGHDEYGLAKPSVLIATITGHVVLGFIFAVGYKIRKRFPN